MTKKYYTIRLPKETKVYIKGLANKMGWRSSYLIKVALKHYIDSIINDEKTTIKK